LRAAEGGLVRVLKGAFYSPLVLALRGIGVATVPV